LFYENRTFKLRGILLSYVIDWLIGLWDGAMLFKIKQLLPILAGAVFIISGLKAITGRQ
jgi:hypothetical protein